MNCSTALVQLDFVHVLCHGSTSLAMDGIVGSTGTMPVTFFIGQVEHLKFDTAGQ
jgi:hypothetical protein